MKKVIELILSIVVLGSSSLCAMVASPKVRIRNNVNRDLKVSWQDRNNQLLNTIISSGKDNIIAPFDQIALGSAIKVEVYGQYIGWTAYPLKIKRTLLIVEFNELNPQAGQDLEVVISQGWSPSLTADYMKYVSEITRPDEDNPLKFFPGLKGKGSLEDLTESDIIGFKDFRSIYKKGRYYLSNDITALDIYRYMFSLPKGDYTKESVKRVYIPFSKKWHPDTGNHDMSPEFAARVFNLARIAHQGLLNSLDPQYQEYQHDPEPVKAEPGPLEVVEEHE